MFNYNVIMLLEAIKYRPCLWDKTLASYKDRFERRTAWEEVFSILDPKFGEMSDEQKRDMSNTVINKWANVRDTFIKAIKTKGNKKRRYIYHDQMQFLMKIIPENEEGDDEEDHSCTKEDAGESSINTSISKIKYEETPEHPEPNHDRRRAQSQPADVEVTCAPGDDGADSVRVMNEDEAFFASLLPTVVRYDENERLEFRIQILAAMKRIKDKRLESGVLIA